MKHTTSRMLFAYWDALRGERAAPERGEIEPAGMRHVLADAFVLALEGPDRAVFRLAGTRLSALVGGALKGRALRELWPRDTRHEVDGLVGTVAAETVGLVAGLVAANENGSRVPLELVLLPLQHLGRHDLRLLGALSPATMPSWAGLVPIASIETRSTRIIQPALEGWAPGLVDPGRPRPGRPPFVVHEGGRA